MALEKHISRGNISTISAIEYTNDNRTYIDNGELKFIGGM
jgi:hypothetical protein